MFFYLLFASVIFNKWLSIVVGIVFTLLYLYAHYVGVSSFSFPLLFVVRDYILLFAMGMVVSVACMSEKMTVFKPVLFAYFGLVLFILVSMDTVMDINLLMKWKTILYGLASSLIVFGLVKAESKGIVFLKYNWVQLLGDSSYALYLIHFPLISILCKLSLSVHMNKFGLFGAITSYLAILAACLLSSVAFHLWIERPVTLYFRPFVKRHG
jgi:exopolysaccharide production protein ExoZ